jgi:hypothetical protein
MQSSQSDFFAGKIDNFRSDFAPLSVEQNNLLAAPDSQYVARVMSLRSSQPQRARVPILRRDVEAMHETFATDGTNDLICYW